MRMQAANVTNIPDMLYCNLQRSISYRWKLCHI